MAIWRGCQPFCSPRSHFAGIAGRLLYYFRWTVGAAHNAAARSPGLPVPCTCPLRETAKGRTGAVPPRHEIAEDTVFVFIDEHLPLAAALEAEYPDAVEIREGVEQGRTLYVAYLVPAHPTEPDAGWHSHPNPLPQGKGDVLNSPEGCFLLSIAIFERFSCNFSNFCLTLLWGFVNIRSHTSATDVARPTPAGRLTGYSQQLALIHR